MIATSQFSVVQAAAERAQAMAREQRAREVHAQAAAEHPSASAHAAGPKDVFEVARASPAAQGQRLGASPVVTRGELAARQAVQIDSAGSRKSAALAQLSAQESQTRQWVAQAFDAAHGHRALPPGVSALKSGDANKVELVQRAVNGDVVGQVTATRQGDQVSFDRVTYAKGGRATRAWLSAGPQGVSSATATWSQARSAAPDVPTVDALENSQQPGVEVNATAIWRSGNSLYSRAYQQGPSGVQQSTTTFGAQNDTSGIHPELAGQFRAGSIDTARTETVVLPAGKGKAGIVDSTAYSQNGVQATSSRVTQAPWQPAHAPNAADLEMLRISRVDDEGHIFQTGAKQWTLEKSDGTNSYDAQTFSEGSNVSSVTRTRVFGANVSSVTGGTTLDAQGKQVPVSARSSETFNPDGSVAQLQQSQTDPAGATTLQDYRCARRMTARGMDLSETLTAEQIDPRGNIASIVRRTDSRLGTRGPELLGTSETLTAPSGARVTVVNGQPVDGAGLNAEQQQLAVQGQIDAARQAKSFLNRGLKNAAILATQEKGVAAGAAGVAGGVAGLVAGADSLEAALRAHNLPRIASSLISTGTAAKTVGANGYQIYKALAGLPSNAPGATAAIRIAGALDHVPGVSEDAATALGIGAGRALGFAGPLAGAFSGGEQIYQGLQSGNGYAIAQGGVALAGAGATAVIVSAASSGGLGIIAEAAGIGAIGGPEALLAGAAVGALTYGAQQLIGLFEPDTSHDIAGLKI